jgi:hypothetical protein
MPECSSGSYYAQPIDPAEFLAVLDRLALLQSGRCFSMKEASGTPIGNIARMVLAPLVGLHEPFLTDIFDSS